jgi:cysteine desulfurase
MNEYMDQHFGNPSSIHWFGREAKKGMDIARKQVSDLLNVLPEEIIFTSGGTEADNLAIKGIAYANRGKGNHIITTKIEHHAVLHTCEILEKEGFEVTYLPVDEYGLVDLDELEASIRPETILMTIMYANNEIGTIQPMKQIAAIGKKHQVYVHSDAVQAAGIIPVDANDLSLDALTLSGHKFYGPKGVGALFVRKGTRIIPIAHGGGHEMGRRAGTENIPGIVGLGMAAELARTEMQSRISRIKRLRDKLLEGIISGIPDIRLNGHPIERLPGNINICVAYVEGESLLLNLDIKGIAASSGSACTSGSLDPSHVLTAIGLPHEIAHGSLRLTLGAGTTEDDVDYVLEVLPEIVDRLRMMSPLSNK